MDSQQKQYCEVSLPDDYASWDLHIMKFIEF